MSTSSWVCNLRNCSPPLQQYRCRAEGGLHQRNFRHLGQSFCRTLASQLVTEVAEVFPNRSWLRREQLWHKLPKGKQTPSARSLRCIVSYVSQGKNHFHPFPAENMRQGRSPAGAGWRDGEAMGGWGSAATWSGLPQILNSHWSRPGTRPVTLTWLSLCAMLTKIGKLFTKPFFFL